MRLRLGLLTATLVALTGAREASATPFALRPPTVVRVVTTTYRYHLSRTSVPAGRVNFAVVNKTNAVIDFKIGDYATPKLRPGSRYLLHTRLTKPGRYIYFASGEYAEMGLVGTLTVR